MGCRGCGGLGATVVLPKGGGTGPAPTAWPCPADHPWYPKVSGLCGPESPFAYKSTVNGGYACLNGSTPTPGHTLSRDGTVTQGMVCPGAPAVIPDNPNAPVASGSAGSSNTTYYVIGGLVVLGLAAYLYMK